jgi:hypothetical protein
MVDDIVTRLRSATTQREWWPRDRLEAADEIERLRADNKHLEKMWLSLVETLRRNARKNAAQVAALAEEKQS